MQFTFILKLRKTFKLISPPHTAPSSAPLLLLLLAEDREINTQKTNKYLKCFCSVFSRVSVISLRGQNQCKPAGGVSVRIFVCLLGQTFTSQTARKSHLALRTHADNDMTRTLVS